MCIRNICIIYSKMKKTESEYLTDNCFDIPQNEKKQKEGLMMAENSEEQRAERSSSDFL